MRPEKKNGTQKKKDETEEELRVRVILLFFICYRFLSVGVDANNSPVYKLIYYH